MDRPRPEPLTFWWPALRQKRSPTRVSSSSLRPGPRSVTTMVETSPLEATSTSTDSPSGVNFSALSITASRALERAIGSAQAVVAGQVPTSRTPLSSASGDQDADALGGQLADVGEPQVRLGVLGEGEVQEVVQDLGEALALGADGGDLLVALGEFQGEQLDAQQQGGQGVAQLVRGVGDEGALLFQHVLDVVGHLVERPGQAPEFRRPARDGDPGLQPAGRDVVGGGVEDAYGPQHPAGQPQRGAEREEHRGDLAGADDQPAAQDLASASARWASR